MIQQTKRTSLIALLGEDTIKELEELNQQASRQAKLQGRVYKSREKGVHIWLSPAKGCYEANERRVAKARPEKQIELDKQQQNRAALRARLKEAQESGSLNIVTELAINAQLAELDRRISS